MSGSLPCRQEVCSRHRCHGGQLCREGKRMDIGETLDLKELKSEQRASRLTPPWESPERGKGITQWFVNDLSDAGENRRATRGGVRRLGKL